MSKLHSTIAFIVPYFGRFNNYFQLWLNSCAANPTIDWFIFTDDKRDYDYPPNVHVAYTTLNKIKQRAEKALSCQVCLEKPYKLCDFKPFYGVMFAEELQGYDFWGYCDVDLVWGDIRHFVTEDLLTNNYKLFSHGHCTILRNMEVVNRFYLLEAEGVIPWQKVVSSPYSFLYDEFDQTNGIFEKHFPDKFHWETAAFDANYNARSLRPTRTTVQWMKAIDTDYVFHWAEGRLTGLCIATDGTMQGQDFMYLHLQKRKICCEISPSTTITECIILHDKITRSIPVTPQKFKQLLPNKSILPYRFKEHMLHVINIIFDNYHQKPYFRGTASYWFDKLFGRTGRYDYRYKK